MASFERSSSQWGFTSYLILILFGALVFNNGPLESDRPPQDNKGRQNIPLDAVAPARLWQDPFSAVLKHRNDIKERKIVVPSHGATATMPGQDHPFFETPTKEVVVLGVMINGGPYAENVERRKRRRYAVLSALAQQNYIPDQSNIIRYFHWHYGEINDMDMYDFIPFEWFTNSESNKKSDVLLLWLQDEAFMHEPTGAFNDLINGLKKRYRENQNLDIRFIGPATSTLLKRIAGQYKQAKEYNKNYVWPYITYSPTATVPYSELGGEVPDNITRTISTDDQLIKQLYMELTLRDSPPLKHSALGKTSDDNRIRETSHVAVISERDTVFGRSMPTLLAKEMGCTTVVSCKGLRAYTYLRGIDGISQDKDDLVAVKEEMAKTDMVNKERPAIGSSQYDYLQRLARTMLEDDERSRKEGKGSIRFIGIFGNDVYDKLLILQAIRPYFPKAVFFTTDLDARLLQKSEYPWTRNLLIASGYGMNLNSAYQGNIPPFRDSYQTSVFNSTMLALAEHNPNPAFLKANETYKPLLFEIGRGQAVRIYQPGEQATENGLDLHPPMAVRPNSYVLISIFFILGAAIFSYYHTALKQLRTRLTRWFTLSWLLLGGITIAAYVLSTNGEPFSILQGVSIWPTIYIRALALLLCLFFLAGFFSMLQKNYNELSQEYFGHVPTGFARRGDMRAFALFMTLTVFVFISCMTVLNNFYIWQSLLAWLVLLSGYFYFILRQVKPRNIGVWSSSSSDIGTPLSIDQLWYCYGDYGQFNDRMFRSLAITMLYLSFACILFMILGAPNLPSRGFSMFIIDKLVLVPTVVSMMLLLFLVVDETRLCTSWIYKFIDRKIEWNRIQQKKLQAYDEAYHPYISEWLNIHIIAARTNVVGKLDYYPFFIIVLMLLSRSTFFDSWSFPTALVIIIGFNVLIAIYCATQLRVSSEKAREVSLRNLSHSIIELRSEVAEARQAVGDVQEKPKAVSPEQKIKLIEELITDIKKVNTGAFRPFRDQPFVRALIIVLGAVSLTVTEYLRLAG